MESVFKCIRAPAPKKRDAAEAPAEPTCAMSHPRALSHPRRPLPARASFCGPDSTAIASTGTLTRCATRGRLLGIYRMYHPASRVPIHRDEGSVLLIWRSLLGDARGFGLRSCQVHTLAATQMYTTRLPAVYEASG